MISKEEIEKAKECLKETIQNTYAEGKAIKLNNALKYIDQLESDKQKLIEKLEEDNEKDKHTVQVYEEMYRNATEEFYKRSYKRTIDMANASRETRKGVLSILKGENQVTVK